MTIEREEATMEEQLRARLAELNEEFEKGQEMLRGVEAQQRSLIRLDLLERVSLDPGNEPSYEPS